MTRTAVELQQRVLAGLGRVGLVAPMPATFPVQVEAYYANVEGRAISLDVPALTDGAVCFVGRDDKGNQVIRLVMTEGCCDGIQRALAALPEESIAAAARTAFRHVRSAPDLRRMLESGVDLKSAGPNDWSLISSETGQTSGVPKMGLLAWNYLIPDEAIKKVHLNKAGIILLVKDTTGPHAPGLGDAMRSGLVAPGLIEPGDASDKATGG